MFYRATSNLTLFAVAFAAFAQGCAGLNNLALTPYDKKRAVERNDHQNLAERQATSAQSRNEVHDNAKREREQQEKVEEQERVQAKADAKAREEQQRKDVASQRTAREQWNHSEVGLVSRACSIQEDLDQFNERIDQERRVGKESGYVNAKMMHDLAANKLTCEDELAELGAEYKALTGKELRPGKAVCVVSSASN